jgi:hypothetical protein
MELKLEEPLEERKKLEEVVNQEAIAGNNTCVELPALSIIQANSLLLKELTFLKKTSNNNHTIHNYDFLETK